MALVVVRFAIGLVDLASGDGLALLVIGASIEIAGGIEYLGTSFEFFSFTTTHFSHRSLPLWFLIQRPVFLGILASCYLIAVRLIKLVMSGSVIGQLYSEGIAVGEVEFASE